MSILSSLAFQLVLLFLIACIAYFGLAYNKKKKFFPLLLLALLLTLPVIFRAPPADEPTAMTIETKNQIFKEQAIFDPWYTEYKKDLDRMDGNWQQFHKILKSFKNDEISIETVHSRLAALQLKTKEFKDKFSQQKPPEKLNEVNYAILIAMIEKTKLFATQQDTVLINAINATAPTHLKTMQHPEQVKLLEKIMILDSPGNLDVAQEIMNLKANLTVKDE